MGKLDFQNAKPKKSNTNGYPFFCSSGIQNVTIADSYMAILLCCLRFLCPKEYRHLMNKEINKPFNERASTGELVKLLLEKEWKESDGLSARKQLR